MASCISRRSTALPLTAALLLALLFLGCRADACTCNLEDTAHVCSEEAGIIIPYANACVAECQGVVDFSPCPPAVAYLSEATEEVSSSSSAARAPGQLLPDARRVTSGNVSSDVINQLADEGFRFVGQFEFVDALPKAGYDRLEPTVEPTGTDGLGPVTESNAADQEGDVQVNVLDGEGDGVAPPPPNRELHVSFPDGFVYVRVKDPQVSDAPSPPSFPGTNRRHRRALASASSARRSLASSSSARRALLQDNSGDNTGIIGVDDRVFRSSASGFPAQSILWLRFQDSEGANYICSSALIAPTVVLTAGHCVFTPGQGAHKNFLLFNGAVTPTAAAVRAAVGGVPVTVKSISLLTRWAQFEDFTADVAVLVLQQPLGSTLGWFGTATDTCRSILAVDPISTFGYPGDKRPGTQWGQDACQIKSAEIASTCVNGTGIFRHDCDIYGGQSGSPVYDSSLYVHGVISFAQEGDFNGSPYLAGSVWTMVKSAVDASLADSLSSRKSRKL